MTYLVLVLCAIFVFALVGMGATLLCDVIREIRSDLRSLR